MTQLRLDLDGAEGHARQLAGQRLHMTEVSALPQSVLDLLRLSWDADNMATVRLRDSEPEPVPVGAVRCCRAGDCQAADQCRAARPHLPHPIFDRRSVCHDYQPYTPGGVMVWSEGLIP